MDPLVPDAVGAPREALATFGTLVRLLAGVDALVCSQVGGIIEGFPTLGTYEGLLVGLGPRVSCGVPGLSRGDNDFLPRLFGMNLLRTLQWALLPVLFLPVWDPKTL